MSMKKINTTIIIVVLNHDDSIILSVNNDNPTTIVNYELAKTSDVQLVIYDLLGQKVATLVSKRQPAGSHKVEWDASSFLSGVYFYRLETNNGFVQSRKLILLKQDYII